MFSIGTPCIFTRKLDADENGHRCRPEHVYCILYSVYIYIYAYLHIYPAYTCMYIVHICYMACRALRPAYQQAYATAVSLFISPHHRTPPTNINVEFPDFPRRVSKIFFTALWILSMNVLNVIVPTPFHLSNVSEKQIHLFST